MGGILSIDLISSLRYSCLLLAQWATGWSLYLPEGLTQDCYSFEGWIWGYHFLPPFVDEYESIISSGKYVSVLRTSLASLGNLSWQILYLGSSYSSEWARLERVKMIVAAPPEIQHGAPAVHSLTPENPLLKHHSVWRWCLYLPVHLQASWISSGLPSCLPSKKWKWWCISGVLAFGRLRKEGQGFKVYLSYMMNSRPCLKPNKQN